MVDADILYKFTKSLQSSLDNYEKKDSFAIDVTTTEKCNFQCDYCFEKDKVYSDRKYSVDTLKKTIYSIIEHPSFAKEFKSLTINFWGGEPTLAVEDILSYVDEFAKNPLIHFFFYTNGTLQENLDRIVNCFIEYDCLEKFSIQISWDGDPLHDVHRLSGTKAYNSEYVKKQIKRYMDMGVRVDVKSTIVPKDFSKMPEVWKSFEKLNEELPQRIVYAPTIDQTYYGNEYLDDFRTAIAKICSYEYDFIKKYNDTMLTWFGKNMYTCSYCTNMCCVDIYGDVYPCHGFLYESEEIKRRERLGDIYHNEWIDNFFNNRHKYEMKLSQICEDCTATNCTFCCVQNSSRSKKETSYERWYDRFKCGRCDYYKIFGVYDMALHRLISKSIGDKDDI